MSIRLSRFAGADPGFPGGGERNLKLGDLLTNLQNKANFARRLKQGVASLCFDGNYTYS